MLGTVLAHAHGLDRQGLAHVRVYAVADPDTRSDAGLWGGVRTTSARSVGPRAVGFAAALGPAIALGDHDILHQHGLWTYVSACSDTWRRATRRPVVVSPHGMLDPWALANSRWKKRLAALLFENRNLAGAACLHALNNAEARAIRRPACASPSW